MANNPWPKPYGHSHNHGCYPCAPYEEPVHYQAPQQMVPTLAPERTLTVGSAPVHVVCDGVIVETETDKEGRTICKYKPDPAFAAVSGMANLLTTISGATAPQLAEFADAVVSALTSDADACEALVAKIGTAMNTTPATPGVQSIFDAIAAQHTTTEV